MPSRRSSPSAETITIEALEAVVDRLFIDMTPEEWLRLEAGNPAHSTNCTLGEIFGDILEIFTSNVLENLHKQEFTIEGLETTVGNKVPATFAEIMDVDGDYHTEHTDHLNRLIVKYLLDRIYHSLDSDDTPRNHFEQARCLSIVIRYMVEETNSIIKDLMVRLCASNEESKKVVVDNPVQPEEPSDDKKETTSKTAEPKTKSKGLTGKIKRFFIKFAHKRSSKVAPMIIPEKTETSPNEDKSLLSVQG